MGYSVYTLARNNHCIQCTIPVFETYKSLLDPFGIHFVHGHNIAYGRKGNLCVGFNYSRSNTLAWSLASLLAITIGRKRHFKKIKGSYPYINYDGCESIPVVQERREGCHCIDEWGIPQARQISWSWNLAESARKWIVKQWTDADNNQNRRICQQIKTDIEKSLIQSVDDEDNYNVDSTNDLRDWMKFVEETDLLN